MKIKIDTKVTFEINGKDAVVDVFELDEWLATVWEKHGHTNNDEAGNPLLDDNGKPKRFLDRAIIDSEFKAYFKEKAKVELKSWHVEAIWEAANVSPTLSEKKRASWRTQAPQPQDSPTSQAFTDPRFAE